jgi:hypothetical protein
MPNVICILCNDTGYTASPEQTRCGCGGKLRVLPEEPQKDNTKNRKNNLKEECLAGR